MFVCCVKYFLFSKLWKESLNRVCEQSHQPKIIEHIKTMPHDIGNTGPGLWQAQQMWQEHIKTMPHDIGNTGPGLWQTQKCGRNI
jgi:hypothetical protein